MSNPFAELKEGQKIVIFNSPPEPVENSFVYVVLPNLVITSEGTILTPDSNVQIIVSSQPVSSFPVTKAAVDAKIKYLFHPFDMPNPTPEPE